MESPIDTNTVRSLDDSDNLTSSASAQRNDQTLKHLLHKITRGRPPRSQELHGLPRTTWKLAHEFRSLNVVNDLLCQEFINERGPLQHQQLIPASSETQILNPSTHRPREASCDYSKQEKSFAKVSTGLVSKNTLNFSSIAAKSARKEPAHQIPIKKIWLNGPRVILSITLASTSWATYHCQMLINIILWSAIISRSGKKQSHFPNKLPLQQLRPFSKIRLCKCTRQEQQLSDPIQMQLWNGWNVR